MLIFDKRRPASREQPDTSPPEGGDCPPFAHPSVGCALRLRRPARRLGRLHGGGACRPPAPLGCAPWRAPARRAPAACRPAGGASAARRAAGPEGFRASGEISKSRRPLGRPGGVGGESPLAGRRWSGPVGRWAVRVQPLAAVPAVHGPTSPVHGRPGHRAQRSRLFGCSSLCVLRTE